MRRRASWKHPVTLLDRFFLMAFMRWITVHDDESGACESSERSSCIPSCSARIRSLVAQFRRGSGSIETYKSALRELGPSHLGRKPRSEQPSRTELKEFDRRARPLLQFDSLWYHD